MGTAHSVRLRAGLTLLGVAAAGDNPIWVEFEVQLPQGANNIFSRYFDGDALRLGQTTMGCFGSNELAGITAGQSYSTRVRVHDIAGHASDWRSGTWRRGESIASSSCSRRFYGVTCRRRLTCGGKRGVLFDEVGGTWQRWVWLPRLVFAPQRCRCNGNRTPPNFIGTWGVIGEVC